MKTRGQKIFSFFNTMILIIVGLVCLLPYLNLLAKSFSDNAAVVSGQVGFWPVNFQTSAYEVLVSQRAFWVSAFNSLFITIVGTVLQVFFTVCVGYVGSRQDFVGRKTLNVLYIITMLFNGGMIPTYIVVKETGLMNNLFSIAIPGLVTAFNFIMVRTYVSSLPPSLEEAARIDGAGNMTILFRIIFPLTIPSVATITIFCAVGIWNNYLEASMYLMQPEKRVLPLYLNNMIQATESIDVSSPEVMRNVATQSLVAATIFVSTVPILIVYPFLQKYFLQGLTVGAVKQ